LLAVTLSCGPGSQDSEAARARFDSALAAHDVAGALSAIDALSAALPDAPVSDLELAQRLGRAGEMTRALWLLEEASRRHPESTEIRLALAETAIIVGAPEQSLAVLDGLPPAAAAGLVPVLLRYRALLALGRLDDALDTLERAESRHAGIELATARLALLASEKQYARALEYVRRVAARDGQSGPERAWLARTEAGLLAELGEGDAALAVLEPLTTSAPGAVDVEAWRSRAALLTGQGRVQDAIAELEQASTEHPDSSGLQSVLANAYISVGDSPAAESVLRARFERHPTAANAINLADFLYRTGRSREGVAVIDGQLARDAQERANELEYLRVALLLDAGDAAAARERFRAFARAFPDDPLTGYLRARFDLLDGRPEAAVVRLKQLLPRLDRADVHHWLAVALERSGDHAGAEQRYGIAVYADPSQVPSYHGLLRTLARRGAWAQVEQWALRLLRIVPDGATAYEALLRARIAAGDPASAEALTRDWVLRHPELLAPRVATSIALRRQGRPEAALAALDEVGERFADSPDWIAERGIVLGRLGRGPEGLASVDAAVVHHPTSQALQRSRAFLLFSAGRGDEGLRAVEALLRLAPDDPQPLQMAGDYLSLQRDFERARSLYERHLAIDPRDVEVLFHLGIALEALGEPGAAIEAYARAAEVAPYFAPAHNNRALLLAREGRRAEALTAAQAAYASAPSDPSVLDTLGWLYHEAGRGGRAVAMLERAAELAPGSVEIRDHLRRAQGERRRDGPARSRRAQPATNAGVIEQLRALAPPNIVLVVVDTLRADWLAPYDRGSRLSPELARWAENGIVFERARAQSSWTKVSMASLMTSLWPRTHGIRLPSDGLSSDAVTLAGVLSGHGYRTYGVQSNGWLEQSFGFQNGFDRYVFPRAFAGGQTLGHASLWPHGERVLEEGLRLLAAHDPASPFLLYLHFMDVHEYAAPPEYRVHGDDKQGLYRAAIRWVDDLLVRLREALERHGHAERTIVVFASDHGETFGENHSEGHARHVLTSVLDVPLIVRLPFEVDGARVSAQVRNIDIAPTLLELAGAPVPDGFEGESLLPLLDASGPHADRPVYAGLGAPILHGVVEQNSLNDGSWLYARNVGGGDAELLFDRALDPSEDVNLIEFEPAVAKRQRARLDDHLGGGAAAGVRETDVRIDPVIAERLRALGYLQ